MNRIPRLSLFRSTVRALALLAVGCLVPCGVRGQAGISGNALDGQDEENRYNTKFERTYQSKSALGQLEELTGATVDRSSESQQAPARPAKAPKPRFNANQAFRNELAGALAGMLLEAVFSDNSAQQKAQQEAAAAQAAALAAAQAEAQRAQQELERKNRLLRAQRYRADWEAREAESDRQLSGAFDVSTGTSFFGRPSRVDPAVLALLGQGGATPVSKAGPPPDAAPVGDPSVVDLRGSSQTVQSLRGATGRTPRPPLPGRGRNSGVLYGDDAEEGSDRPVSETRRQLAALNGYFGPMLDKWYWETVLEGSAKTTLWGFAKNVRGQQYAKALYDFKEQRDGLVEDVGDADKKLMELALGESDDLVRTLALPGAGGMEKVDNYWTDLAKRAAEARIEFYRLAIGQGFSKAELDLGETGLLGDNE